MNCNNENGHCDCKHIKGIHCDVKNCVHHDGDCYCTADKISVGATYANKTEDAACVTFEKKEI